MVSNTCLHYYPRRFPTVVIIAMFGGLVIGGAIFAVLKNSGGSSKENKPIKLNIG